MVFFQGSRQIFKYVINSYNPIRINSTQPRNYLLLQTKEASSVHFNGDPPNGEFVLLYNSDTIAQYFFKYEEQMGATNELVTGYIQHHTTSDRILPCLPLN